MVSRPEYIGAVSGPERIRSYRQLVSRTGPYLEKPTVSESHHTRTQTHSTVRIGLLMPIMGPLCRTCHPDSYPSALPDRLCVVRMCDPCLLPDRLCVVRLCDPSPLPDRCVSYVLCDPSPLPDRLCVVRVV